jgi:hypothetical protein
MRGLAERAAVAGQELGQRAHVPPVGADGVLREASAQQEMALELLHEDLVLGGRAAVGVCTGTRRGTSVAGRYRSTGMDL